MKKMFAAVILASVALAACGGKKADTTPQGHTSPEAGGATGGATYGVPKAPAATPGATAPASGTPPASTANPCAGK
ncbi:MAG TPA: hypothetical protein VH165_11745 [Kofleriaceae bacterium]|jgi:hypothetical protein|nr:hypothetical protein [Kofleriaceae bacterium]